MRSPHLFDPSGPRRKGRQARAITQPLADALRISFFLLLIEMGGSGCGKKETIWAVCKRERSI